MKNRHSPSLAAMPVLRRESRGLLCGWDLARSRGLGGSGGAREQPVLKKHALTHTTDPNDDHDVDDASVLNNKDK